MNNSQQEASLTGNIRKRDDDAEPNPSLDDGEVDNTNELRRKRYTLSRNDRVEDDNYNYLFSSSSSNNNNELSTSTSSTSISCVLQNPLSNRTNNTTNAYASLVSSILLLQWYYILLYYYINIDILTHCSILIFQK